MKVENVDIAILLALAYIGIGILVSVVAEGLIQGVLSKWILGCGTVISVLFGWFAARAKADNEEKYIESKDEVKG